MSEVLVVAGGLCLGGALLGVIAHMLWDCWRDGDRGFAAVFGALFLGVALMLLGAFAGSK